MYDISLHSEREIKREIEIKIIFILLAIISVRL